MLSDYMLNEGNSKHVQFTQTGGSGAPGGPSQPRLPAVPGPALQGGGEAGACIPAQHGLPLCPDPTSAPAVPAAGHGPPGRPPPPAWLKLYLDLSSSRWSSSNS